MRGGEVVYLACLISRRTLVRIQPPHPIRETAPTLHVTESGIKDVVPSRATIKRMGAAVHYRLHGEGDAPRHNHKSGAAR